MNAIEAFIPFTFEASWQEVLAHELAQPYMSSLAAFVEKEYAIHPHTTFPPKDLIFNAFNCTPYHQVQVVIMGQDPYHGAGQAHGLSFSVPYGIKPPPSLVNIYKEIESDIGIPPATHGCLINWTRQGVLLLNATLTVQEGKPLSHHGRGWERFTDAVIRTLMKREDPVIFVLWGKSAQEKCRFLSESTTTQPHYILTAPHPSPFSVHSGFFGCKHFSKINELLVQQGKAPIDWHV